ncbi:MAG: DUF2017 family protein [Verrucomicrobiales bacterium]|nr:DUF2017 family protein [Verrucomicrobiales bacterium]
MKLLRCKAKDDVLVFGLSDTEGELLQLLLRLYPRIPTTYNRISKTMAPTEAEEAQRLLEEELERHRRNNIREVAAVLNERKLLTKASRGFRLTLSPEQFEWLLQVLNDVRVGSWLAIGAPDTEHGEEIQLTEETAPHVWAMETAGYFEMALLSAVDSPSADPDTASGQTGIASEEK